MIRYELDQIQLKADILKMDRNWFAKARRRTTKFVSLGRFEEDSSIWSAAKPAFMILQSNKCAFCERQFTRPDESRIEMDLEHFRPKGEVGVWVSDRAGKPYPDDTGGASDTGYYWLAYDPANYLAACKICNSQYKHVHFPIAGPRCRHPGDEMALRGEKPYLTYPVGDGDDDPEELVTFTGTVARPAVETGWRHERGALIIDFFGLNSRDQLHVQRAEIIERFGGALAAVADGRASQSDRTYVAMLGNPIIPHASCLRAFAKLWYRDERSARRLYDACREMLARRLVDSTLTGLGIGLV
jgi:hypothetical protein